LGADRYRYHSGDYLSPFASDSWHTSDADGSWYFGDGGLCIFAFSDLPINDCEMVDG